MSHINVDIKIEVTIEKKITKFITLKFLPKINFKIDSSFDKFRQIDDILKRPEVVKDLQINSNKN